MQLGQPLSDADRLRELIDRELTAGRGLVPACSALRGEYRDALDSPAGAVRFLYLKVRPDTAQARLEARGGHYMPASLVPRQFAAFEEPASAMAVDGELEPMQVVEAALEKLA